MPRTIETDDLLAAACQSAPVLIIGVDAEARIVLFNRCCERLTGLRRKNVVGQSFVTLLIPADRREEVTARFRAATNEELSRPHVYPWCTASGQTRAIEWHCCRIGSGHGGPWIVGFGHDVETLDTTRADIERRRQLREAVFSYIPEGIEVADVPDVTIRRAGDFDLAMTGIAWRDITLRNEVERMLDARTEGLKLADQAKNDVVATIVHELRQPINAALAALAVMKERPGRDRGEHARQTIERQLLQMSAITADLVDSTRVVRGQISLRLVPHDIGVIVRRAIDTVAPAAAERRIRLSFPPPATPASALADDVRLEQVFVNLLSNAVQYTPDGGEIAVRIEVNGDGIVVRVRDTGEGIAPERLPHIFDLFVRGGSSRGLGIGLAVAKTLVDAHGGMIEARSEGPGRGAEFAVHFPCL